MAVNGCEGVIYDSIVEKYYSTKKSTILLIGVVEICYNYGVLLRRRYDGR